jgi:hypothetical protein
MVQYRGLTGDQWGFDWHRGTWMTLAMSRLSWTSPQIARRPKISHHGNRKVVNSEPEPPSLIPTPLKRVSLTHWWHECQ